MPLQATSGAASYDAFGGGVAAVPNYIEECFATHLYTGNGSTQTITNGIDLAGKGGLVWCKVRNTTSSHFLFDTARGANALFSNLTNGQQSEPQGITSFNTNGFTLGTNGGTNGADNTFASWTFREQPKFFDVVTWSGDSVGGRQISHNLQSVPGCIIIKTTSTTSNWTVVHRSLPAWDYFLRLNTTDAADNAGGLTQAPTSTQFSATGYNDSGRTYVAYLFAHNAGGFGLTGTDNVISCGSYTGNGSTTGPVVTLGYEPQWFMVKRATGGTADWLIYDNMRGAGSNNTVKLQPNTSNAEDTMGEPIGFTATGFQPLGADSEINANGSTYIYIAIRRGPMKVPTTGTSVYSPKAFAGNGSTNTQTTGFPVDMFWNKTTSVGPGSLMDRLRDQAVLRTNATFSEANIGTYSSTAIVFQNNTGLSFVGGASATDGLNESGINVGLSAFRRAPGFFDEVCYTGTGSATTQTHNLGVAPELMIVKRRNASGNGWATYCAPLGNTAFLYVNSTGAADSGFNQWNNTSPTATQFSVSTSSDVNASGGTYVAYLFASCPGVSKVGSYTGNGSSQTINCGFTGGARFVMIKRTDSTGDWYVWDTARGIVSGNDPHLSLNTTAAEVTSNDTIDTDSTGFVVNQVSATNVNVSSATYIFLAIA